MVLQQGILKSKIVIRSEDSNLAEHIISNIL